MQGDPASYAVSVVTSMPKWLLSMLLILFPNKLAMIETVLVAPEDAAHNS